VFLKFQCERCGFPKSGNEWESSRPSSGSREEGKGGMHWRVNDRVEKKKGEEGGNEHTLIPEKKRKEKKKDLLINLGGKV